MAKICTICRSDFSKVLYITPKFDVIRCRKCGLVYVNNSLTYDEMEDIYEHYSSVFMHEIYLKTQNAQISDFTQKVESIEKFAPRKGKLLDIGCGYGFFLEAARRGNWEVYGIDISKHAADYAQNKFSLNVSHGTIEDARFPECFFDVITMWDLIEHLNDPRDFIQKVRQYVKQNGLIVIKTPNQDSLYTHLGDLIYKISAAKILFPILSQYGYSHLYRFSPMTIKSLLEQEGFRVFKTIKENSNLKILTQQHKNYAEKLHMKTLLYLISFFAEVLQMQNQIIVYAKKC